MNKIQEKIQIAATKMTKKDVNAKVNYGKPIINLKNDDGEIEFTLSNNKQFIKNKTSQRGSKTSDCGLILKLDEPIKLINPQNQKPTEWYYVSFANETVKQKYSDTVVQSPGGAGMVAKTKKVAAYASA